MREGVRKNTKKPVSRLNQRKKVDVKQAAAIAYSEARKSKPGCCKKKQWQKGVIVTKDMIFQFIEERLQKVRLIALYAKYDGLYIVPENSRGPQPFDIIQ